MTKLICAAILSAGVSVSMAAPPAPPASQPNSNAAKMGPDSEHHDGVPEGKVTKYEWKESKVFPGYEHDYYVYLPAQYDGKTPAALMVFQDGRGYADVKGSSRVPVVFDNLIARGEMPVTIGVFIDPGHKGPKDAKGKYAGSNRSFEYDTLSADYSKFLLEEILPEVGKSCKITDDPELRAIGGASSGGICAFTVAWQRPDSFRKVLSIVGSFTDIRGGDHYPSLVRHTKAKPKPIRVFLEEGDNDLDNDAGSWPLANMQMAAALKYAGYDYKIVWGQHAHSGVYGGIIMPDTLRWLWRDWNKKPESK